MKEHRLGKERRCAYISPCAERSEGVESGTRERTVGDERRAAKWGPIEYAWYSTDAAFGLWMTVEWECGRQKERRGGRAARPLLSATCCDAKEVAGADGTPPAWRCIESLVADRVEHDDGCNGLDDQAPQQAVAPSNRKARYARGSSVRGRGERRHVGEIRENHAGGSGTKNACEYRDAFQESQFRRRRKRRVAQGGD